MPVKIRLMRIGAKKRPFYRVIAVDERNKRNGAYLELLGTYNPLTEPKEINLKQDKIDAWLKKGAVKSDGFLRIIGEAPQRPARKPKKERAEKPVEAPKPEEKAETTEEIVEQTPEDQPTSEEQTETAPAEETPVEAQSEDQSVGESESDTSESPTTDNPNPTEEVKE